MALGHPNGDLGCSYPAPQLCQHIPVKSTLALILGGGNIVGRDCSLGGINGFCKAEGAAGWCQCQLTPGFSILQGVNTKNSASTKISTTAQLTLGRLLARYPSTVCTQILSRDISSITQTY